MHQRFRTNGLVALLSLTVLAASGGTVLGQDEEPVTLRLALSDDHGNPADGPLAAFVQAAHELSGGAVTIDTTWAAGGADGERRTVKRLADGDFDLALAPTRAWEAVGVTKPEALLTPFLIDNDALSVAVATSPIAQDLLAGMTDQGFAGLGIWPESLRHPAVYDKCGGPILDPSDLAGMSMRVPDEAVADDLLSMMGAKPSFGDPEVCGTFQGTEIGLVGTLALPVPATLTADVTFFPKYYVLGANAAAFERLPDRWQQVLRDAASAAQTAAINGDPTDVRAALSWCQARNSVVIAGPDAVARFKAAAQPEVDKLSSDPNLALTIQAIEALKATVKPSPNASPCQGVVEVPASFAPADAPTPIDGTWVVSTTEEELAAIAPDEAIPGNWGDLTATFDAGHLTGSIKSPSVSGTSYGATYRVDGNLLTMFDPNACCPVEPFYFYWQINGDTLTLSKVPGRTSPSGWVVKPWTRLKP